MRYSTKVRIRKTVLISIATIVFIALNIWVFSMIIGGNTPIEKSAVLIAKNIDDRVFAYDGGAIAISGTMLTCYDTEGNISFTFELPETGMSAYKNGDITVCWKPDTVSNLIIVINNYGKQLLRKQIDVQEILLAVCNDDQFSVAALEEDQTWIKTYDINGTLIEETIQPFLSTLSIGYFGNNNAQLWTLMLDYHGTLPITRLYTSYPGVSQTGRIAINNQVCYEVVPMSDFVYLVGTHHIQSRTYTNTKISEWLINGWTLQDYYVNNSKGVAFLFAPVDTTQTDTPLSAVWYINPETEEQYRISLPADIKRAVLTDKKIYAISNEGIYNMNINGQKRSFSKLPFTVDEVIGVSQGKSITLRSGNEYYMIKLK